MPQDLPTPRTAGKSAFDGVRFMIVNWLLGALVGFFITMGFLAFDIGRLRTLLLGDSNGVLALALLAAGMSLTFAGLYASVTIMLTFSKKEP